MAEKKQKYYYLVIGNWKMNPTTLREAKGIYRDVKKNAGRWSGIRVVTAPPATYLAPLADYKSPANFELGGQNCFFEESGSHTGEISYAMLKDLGCRWVILGHSERRAQGEDSATVARKAGAVLSAGLRPVICVGEEKRDAEGEYLAELENQILASVKGVKEADLPRVVIAYEPVWAIGRKDNRALSGESVLEMNIFIKRSLSRKYSRKKAMSVEVLYGGSVTADNTREIVESGQVNGLLVGRQSLEPVAFAQILELVKQVKDS